MQKLWGLLGSQSLLQTVLGQFQGQAKKDCYFLGKLRHNFQISLTMTYTWIADNYYRCAPFEELLVVKSNLRACLHEEEVIHFDKEFSIYSSATIHSFIHSLIQKTFPKPPHEWGTLDYQ